MEKELAYQIAHAELTKGQVRLAGYILNNQKRVLGMTALEVGREVGMSDASVIRFCRAVGYSGFANLKVQLQKELSLHSEKIGKHSLYDRFVMQEEKYSKDELDLSEMLTLMGGNLENSLRQNPAATFHTVADKLLSARKKIIIGLRGGKGCAVRFARLLQFLSSDVACISDEGQDELCSLAELTGQDVVLDILANYLHQEDINAGRTYLSSFEGLLALYQGKVDAAACHLYDGKECNASFVRSLMPGVSAVLVNLSYRTQGFYVRKSNPKHITGWEDLRRADISILNRRVGSSSRILLDTQLKKLEIPSGQLKGYDKIMSSHLTMASAIAAGDADLAIGTERITHQLEGLDFIPLLEERFDLVLQKESLENPAVVKMLAILSSPVFRREVTHFSGNDYRDLGKIIMEV